LEAVEGSCRQGLGNAKLRWLGDGAWNALHRHKNYPPPRVPVLHICCVSPHCGMYITYMPSSARYFWLFMGVQDQAGGFLLVRCDPRSGLERQQRAGVADCQACQRKAKPVPGHASHRANWAPLHQPRPVPHRRKGMPDMPWHLFVILRRLSDLILSRTVNLTVIRDFPIP
jgi:hypothetical protein